MANNLLYYRAIIYKDAVHRPLGTDERLTVDSIPVSAIRGNQIREREDGLYVGVFGDRDVYYVSETDGEDAPTSGAKETPFKTLDYATAAIFALNGGDPQISFTIALKAGDTFTMTRYLNVAGNIMISFYGDPKYGDFNDPGRVGNMSTYMPVDLQRPIINMGFDPDTSGGIGGFSMLPASDGRRVRITFAGIRMNLPTGTYSTGLGAIVSVQQLTDVQVFLQGCIVNAPGDNSIYGFLSVLPSSQVFFYQFGSQFRVDDIQIGAQPTPPPTPIQLARRKWFIKMNPDFSATEQSGFDPLMINSSPGTGLLSLSWTDTPTATAPDGTVAQNTWPVLNNATFGFAQYVTILHRDTSGRPLNVISGRSF